MIKKRIIITTLSLVLIATFGTMALAADYQVTITNLTPSQVISPPLVFAHSIPITIGGLPSSPGTELLAEGGDSSVLIAELATILEVGEATTAAGPLLPGASVTLSVKAEEGFDYVSALGMLVTTNDTFFGLISSKISDTGQTIAYANAWDAGTEVNDETCENIPGPPCNGSGPGGTDENGVIHIGSGIHGIDDLTSAANGWQNPVVQVVVTTE